MSVRRYYPSYDRPVNVVPLLFEDKPCPQELPRRYVSFIGHAVKVKGVGRFFSLVEQAAQQGLALEFQIVTSSDISEYLERLSPSARALLRVVNSPRLTDEEISRAARESICILALYETVMQSGVVPVAFMNGTPVIATDLDGLTEFVRHGQTGWIVPVNPRDEEVFEAISQVKTRLVEMSARCRHEYEVTFDMRNWGKYYGWLLSQVAIGTTSQVVVDEAASAVLS